MSETGISTTLEDAERREALRTIASIAEALRDSRLLKTLPSDHKRRRKPTSIREVGSFHYHSDREVVLRHHSAIDHEWTLTSFGEEPSRTVRMTDLGPTTLSKEDCHDVPTVLVHAEMLAQALSEDCPDAPGDVESTANRMALACLVDSIRLDCDAPVKVEIDIPGPFAGAAIRGFSKKGASVLKLLRTGRSEILLRAGRHVTLVRSEKARRHWTITRIRGVAGETDLDDPMQMLRAHVMVGDIGSPLVDAKVQQ